MSANVRAALALVEELEGLTEAARARCVASIGKSDIHYESAYVTMSIPCLAMRMRAALGLEPIFEVRVADRCEVVHVASARGLAAAEEIADEVGGTVTGEGGEPLRDTSTWAGADEPFAANH